MDSLTSAGQKVTDWLQNRLLGAVLATQKQQGRMLASHENQIREVRSRMSALGDAVQRFRSDVDAETTRISNILAELKRRLDEGDATAATEVSADLAPVIDHLRAIGTGSGADPVSVPEVPTGSGAVDGV